MNQTLQNIMVFINEHTLLLIGICIFLILVLIGYLVDNSVKSKRVRNDIKNPDQVPENIKDEIIKQAEEKTIKKEDAPVEADSLIVDTPMINDQNNLNEVQNVEINNSDEVQNIEINDSNETLTFDLENSNDILNIPVQNEVPVEIEDPDKDIMNPNTQSEYSNDKKLSEILFQLNDIQNNDSPVTEEIKSESENNIFNNDSSNIVINDDVKKDDVQIQANGNASDELDRIMRKLSTMNNNVEDDNYTNIF